MEKIPRRVLVTREYRVEYHDPICVTAGERVSVGREDNEFPGWRWCKAEDGREGWIPVELLDHVEEKAIILQNYTARELAVQPGEEVTVEDSRHD